LKQVARQDRDRGVAAIWVLTPQESMTIVGYYTLSALSVERVSLPGDVAGQLPRYESLPAVLLGRLAVDQRYQGQGIGSVLIADALARAVQSTAQVGAALVVVDAKNERARSIYQRYGFQHFPDHDMRLFMTMATIKKLLASMTDDR
jgi:GNAT superfamily N-acetyltransferase